jgi:hypothetical protein
MRNEYKVENNTKSNKYEERYLHCDEILAEIRDSKENEA